MGISKSRSRWTKALNLGGHIVARTFALAVVTSFAISQISTDALAKRQGSSHSDDPSAQMEQAAREAERQRKEQEKQAQEQQKQAERQRKEQEKQARDAQEQAERQRKEQDQQQREAQKQSERQRQDQEKQTRSDSPRVEVGNDGRGRDTNDRVSNEPDKRQNDDRTGKTRDAKQDDKKNDESKDDSADKPKQNDQATKDNKPPATIKEWLERATGTSSGRPEVSPAADRTPPAAQSNTMGNGQRSTSEKPIASKPQRSWAPIEFPEFRANEVLAVNLSGKALERSKQMGFTVKTVTSLNASNVTVTKLVPPVGMSAVEGEAKLKQVIPASEFALNRQYSIYKTATGTAPSSAHEKKSSLGDKTAGPACGGDHCFGREMMGWHAALNQCSRGLKIGIIDTGVDLSHPAFVGKKIEVEHMGDGGVQSGVRNANWHGTGVTALLAGDVRGGVSGLSPEANFAVADAFYAGADEQPTSDTLSMLRAFDWLEKRDVKIINMSLSGPPDDLIKRAIDRLSAKGVVLVAAAGNNGPSAAPSYPAAYQKVIAVTAVNKEFAGYRYANRGDYVDFAGPGVAVWTAMPGGSGTYHSGTSFAAPFVTAAIAAVYKELPGKTADDVVSALKSRDLGAPGKDAVYGNGLVLAPETCRGGAVASVGGGQSERSSVGGQEASSQPTASQTEILPWLGFAPE